ncbi:MAG: hypothetical protein WD042_17725 [Phycisphaeraceae bacterium]
MDQQLSAMIGAASIPGESGKSEVRIRLAYAECQIEFTSGKDDPTPQRYTLKPLADLYGQPQASPGSPVDPRDPTYSPLFMAIEEEIGRTYASDPSLSDGAVELALDLLATDPAADLRHEPLAHSIQLALRLLLSLNSYSRDEVRQTLRKIRKSVQWHTRESGRRGYLDFISDFLPG